MYFLKSPVALATAVVASALITFQISDANATTYFDWSFSGGSSSGSGTLQATYDGGDFYSVTSISGTANGQTILGLSNYNAPDQLIFYNVSSPVIGLDSYGVSFSVGSGAQSFSIYEDNGLIGSSSPYYCDSTYCLLGPGNTETGGAGNPVVAVSLSMVDPPPPATPLPAALPLFCTGLGLVGFLVRRKKQKSAAAIAVA